jgi:hypothetical protein
MLLAIPLIALMIPLMMSISAMIFDDATGFASAGVIMSGICCIAYLPVLIVLDGIIRAYIGSAWTLTFLRLTKGPAVEEPMELPLDEPEPLPEVAEETVVEASDEASDEADAPAEEEAEATETGDALPEDF